MLNVITGLHAGGVAASTTAYESIATINVGSGGSSTVTFSSIPNTYKHLQIRAMAADTGNGFFDITTRINGDSGSNYAGHQLYGQGSSAAASVLGGSTPVPQMYTFYTSGTNGGASSAFGVLVLDILDYASTTKNKTLRGLLGSDTNGNGFILFRSHVWLNSSTAISSISFTPSNSLAQYSQFALYGVK